MSATPILELSAIEKRFPGVVALDGVDLSVDRGEVLGLAGENGAGKSTLMKILGGVYQPDGGQLKIDDQFARLSSVADAFAAGIAFIHQELNVLDNLNLAENVFLGREPVWARPLSLVDRRKMHTEAATYLRRLGLHLPTQTPLAELSLAQRQLVEIAKALSLNARIVIMDEPTSSLTLAETERLLAVIDDLRAEGISVIYISHRLGEIQRIADRVVVLRDGRNAGELPRREITHDRIVDLMVGRELATASAAAPIRGRSPLVEIERVRTRRYPRENFSLQLWGGEVLGVAGLMGAGRSEAFEALFGIDPILAGSIQMEGVRVLIRSPRDAIARGIFLVPEDRRRCGLILEQSVRENISLPFLRRWSTGGLVSRAAERKAADDLTRRLKVKTPSIETSTGTLSGGNQQKVVLAKWLAQQPRVMIFDEPTRGIDVGAKAEIYQLMRQLADEGVAVVMISSDLEEILGQSDRIAVMREGAVSGLLDRTHFSEDAIMTLAVGRSEVAA